MELVLTTSYYELMKEWDNKKDTKKTKTNLHNKNNLGIVKILNFWCDQ